MDDPFESKPVSGAALRKQADKAAKTTNHAPLAPLSTNVVDAGAEEVLSPEPSAATLRARLQAALEDQSSQLEMVGKWGQQLLAQQTELEERIHGLGDVDQDGDEIDDATAAKLLDLQEAMKSWEAENQNYAQSLQKQNVSVT